MPTIIKTNTVKIEKSGNLYKIIYENDDVYVFKKVITSIEITSNSCNLVQKVLP